MGYKNKLSRMVPVLLIAFCCSQVAYAQSENPADGILCTFQPADTGEDIKTVLLTSDAEGKFWWKDQNALEPKSAWYISSNTSQISFANVSKTAAPRMLTLTTAGAGLLTVHAPNETGDLNEVSYTGTCTILGEGLI